MALLIIRFGKDQELEVHTATYGPGIDQSQHAKSVSHISQSINFISSLTYIYNDFTMFSMNICSAEETTESIDCL